MVSVNLFSPGDEITLSIYKINIRLLNLLVAVLAPFVKSLVEFLREMSEFVAFLIRGA